MHLNCTFGAQGKRTTLIELAVCILNVNNAYRTQTTKHIMDVQSFVAKWLYCISWNVLNRSIQKCLRIVELRDSDGIYELFAIATYCPIGETYTYRYMPSFKGYSILYR